MEIFSSGFWLMSVFKAADSSCFVVSEVGYFMLIFPPGSRKMDGMLFYYNTPGKGIQPAICQKSF